MIAQSIVADHDLDLANNYAHDDGRLFGHEHLDAGRTSRGTGRARSSRFTASDCRS